MPANYGTIHPVGNGHFMKRCTSCLQEKPLTEFWADKRRPNGRLAKCKECKTAKIVAWRQSQPDLNKRRYWANRDSERYRHLVKKYGITLSNYFEMLLAQGGACAICGRPEPKNKSLNVDHDHQTGEVRGLLCTNCNQMIGHAADSRDRLEAGARYLESYRKSPRNSSKRQSKQ